MLLFPYPGFFSYYYQLRTRIGANQQIRRDSIWLSWQYPSSLISFLFDLILLKNIRKNLDRRNEMRWCLAIRTNDLLRPMRHRPFIVPRLLVKSAIEIVKSETRFCTISFRPSSWCQISTSDICEAIIFDTRSIDRERDFVLIQSHGMSASVFSPPAIATIIRRCLRPTRWRAFRSKGLLRSAENEQHPRN